MLSKRMIRCKAGIGVLISLFFTSIWAGNQRIINMVDEFACDNTGKQSCTLNIAEALKKASDLIKTDPTEQVCLYFPAGTYLLEHTATAIELNRIKPDKGGMFTIKGDGPDKTIFLSANKGRVF